MRFIPIDFVREGMILAKPLYSENGNFLLGQGTQIIDPYIKRIKELGYNGIYIDDELSKGIEIKNLISDNLKNKSVQTLKSIYINTSNSQNSRFTDKTEKIEELIDKIIDEILENDSIMVNLIDLKVYDDYTYYHSVSVTTLAIVLGTAVPLSKNELCELGMAAMLHDIGKLFVDKSVLNKNGELTEEEFDTIKNHSYLGYRFLKDRASIPVKSAVAILQHHEKFNGNGYPNGTVGTDISLYGRILSVVDVYDALTSDRCYRKALMPSEAMEYLMGNGGVMFDPEIVKLFCRRVSPYPVGTLVKLSNGEFGIVRENFENWGLRPLIELIDIGTNTGKNKFYDLHKDADLINITITEIANI
jgi:HD-GYP domain